MPLSLNKVCPAETMIVIDYAQKWWNFKTKEKKSSEFIPEMLDNAGSTYYLSISFFKCIYDKRSTGALERM